jgi:c-di-GMP-binding flagellar brake protein YcgR
VSGELLSNKPERRASKRFSIEREIRYRIVRRGPEGQTGSGKTVNMSNGGILISTDRALSLGALVEVEVDWPSIEGLERRLLIKGIVVRCIEGERTLAALRISRHEFL